MKSLETGERDEKQRERKEEVRERERTGRLEPSDGSYDAFVLYILKQKVTCYFAFR